jgi:hypothetical protein
MDSMVYMKRGEGQKSEKKCTHSIRKSQKKFTHDAYTAAQNCLILIPPLQSANAYGTRLSED